MAKGAHLTPEVKTIVTKIYSEGSIHGPTKTREELLKRMKKRGLDRNFGPDWPSVSAVSKLLTEYQRRDSERSLELKRLDEPWTFGSLAEYPLPPEAIPLVASIYSKCLMEGAPKGWLISVREALWIGRLHKIVEFYHSRDILPHPNAEVEAIILQRGERPEGYQEIKFEDLILDWAYVYASYEALNEIEGEPFISNQLDSDLIGNVFDYYGERRQDFIYVKAEEYGVDDDKYKELNLLPMEEIHRFFLQLEIDKQKKEAQHERTHRKEG